MAISVVEAVLGAWLVQAPGSLGGGVSGVMPQAVPAESSGLQVARSALVLEGGPGGLRPIGLLGRPGLAWQVPATRARSGGPVVVAADDPDATALNRDYGWWLASKPGWVNPGWYTAPLRAEVRALTRFAPGAELLLALTRLSWYSEGSCPGGHDSEPGWDDTGVGVRGSRVHVWWWQRLHGRP